METTPFLCLVKPLTRYYGTADSILGGKFSQHTACGNFWNPALHHDHPGIYVGWESTGFPIRRQQFIIAARLVYTNSE
jgi:hypothetical protein